MAYQTHKFERLASLVAQHAPQEGVNYSSLKSVGTYKLSSPQGRTPIVDLPAIWMVVQGKKVCYVGNRKYENPMVA